MFESLQKAEKIDQQRLILVVLLYLAAAVFMNKLIMRAQIPVLLTLRSLHSKYLIEYI